MELPNKVLATIIGSLVDEALHFDISVHTVEDLVNYLNGCGDAYIEIEGE